MHFLDLGSARPGRYVCVMVVNYLINLKTCIFKFHGHLENVFQSIQTGGFWRCLCRNKHEKDVQRSLASFDSHLRDRGFSIRDLGRLSSVSTKLAVKQQCRRSVHKVFLKVAFNKGGTLT